MWIYKHDLKAKLDYGFDWNPWLADGETITKSTWDISGKTSDDDPSNINKVSTGINSGEVIIWLEAGAKGEDYVVDNEIETSDGRKDSRSFEIRVVDR